METISSITESYTNTIKGHNISKSELFSKSCMFVVRIEEKCKGGKDINHFVTSIS